ncbi:hypothetical protein AYO38_08200 [bacterium SCGC AG-212-C10]|nr:hypothetical protein AYO38_08200 [bacterium SCGC AG-212-C10]
MGIVAWLVFGLLAGALAQVLLPGDDPGSRSAGGFVITIVVGIVGAIAGGFVGSALGFGGVTGFDFRSFLVAVLGALLLLGIWRAISGRTHAHA